MYNKVMRVCFIMTSGNLTGVTDNDDLIRRYAPPSPEGEGFWGASACLSLQGKVAFAKQMTDEVVLLIPDPSINGGNHADLS